MSIIKLQTLLKTGDNDKLSGLALRAKDMDRLKGILESGLSSDMAPHLVAANLRPDGMLVLVVDSPAWAARFRFETAKLMEIASSGGVAALSCRVIVTQDQAGSVTRSGRESEPQG
jgi:hypothetical protein